MVLKVRIERFAEEIKARLGVSECYVAPMGSGSLATAGNPEKKLILAADSPHPAERLIKQLSRDGITANEGHWALTVEDLIEVQPCSAYIGAVSYKSKEAKPGLWVDAFPDDPSPADVLLALYNEFKSTGEITDITFEEFSQLAHPNV